MATHPSGAVSLCCRVDFTQGRGMARDWMDENANQSRMLSLGQQTPREMVNSRMHRETRMQMLKGERPAVCRGCYECEDRGLESKRQMENRRFSQFNQDQARAITSLANGSIDPDWRFLELRLGNLCNLKCRTCNPHSSSRWQGDYEQLRDKWEFMTSFGGEGDFDWPEREEVWNDFTKHSQNLELIYINGGEPMLIDKHWSFLSDLVSSGRSSQIELLYNINMTYLPQRAFELWGSFKKVHVGASIDDVDSRNRYIRHPADWNKVVAHLRLIRDCGLKSVSVGITQTVSAMNFFYLDALYDFASSERVSLGHNYVYDPAYLSPSALPQSVRLKALQELKKRLPQHLWEPLQKSFSGPDVPQLWQQFKAFTRHLDRQRGESFADVFPEFLALAESVDVACDL